MTVSSRLPPAAGELAGVDVDDGHRLGAVDHQRAARGQPHLAVECLRQLLVDAVSTEDVHRVVGAVPLHARQQVGCDRADVGLDRVPGVVALDDQLREVLVEQVADDLHQQVGLLVQRLRLPGGFRPAALSAWSSIVVPLRLQTGHVARQFVLADAFRRGADDHPGVGRNDLAEDVLETLALGVRQLAADPGRRSTRARRPGIGRPG